MIEEVSEVTPNAYASLQRCCRSASAISNHLAISFNRFCGMPHNTKGGSDTLLPNEPTKFYSSNNIAFRADPEASKPYRIQAEWHVSRFQKTGSVFFLNLRINTWGNSGLLHSHSSEGLAVPNWPDCRRLLGSVPMESVENEELVLLERTAPPV